jgi:hypothetical protein
MQTAQLIFKKELDKSKGPAVCGWNFLTSAEPPELAQSLTMGQRIDSYNQVMRDGGWSFTGSERPDEVTVVWNFRRGETDLEKLLIALETHDWTYEYSDSHAVWQRGSAERSHIRALVAKTGDEGRALYEEHAAKNGMPA